MFVLRQNGLLIFTRAKRPTLTPESLLKTKLAVMEIKTHDLEARVASLEKKAGEFLDGLVQWADEHKRSVERKPRSYLVVRRVDG
jgi:hypothetical protein